MLLFANFFDREPMIRVNAYICSDIQAFFDYVTRRQFRVVLQCARSRLGIGPARTDRVQVVDGIDHVTGTGDQQ